MGRSGSGVGTVRDSVTNVNRGAKDEPQSDRETLRMKPKSAPWALCGGVERVSVTLR